MVILTLSFAASLYCIESLDYEDSSLGVYADRNMLNHNFRIFGMMAFSHHT